VLLGFVIGACAPPTGGPGPAPASQGASASPAAGAPSSESVADFYRGKTITIIVGLAPGGGFDTTARLLAKHMGKHVPGNPNFIVENMDGAGSLLALNHVYNVARPDGLTMGTFNELQVLNQVTGAEGVQFDARKLGWVGSAVKATTACTIRADSPYRVPEDLVRKDLPPLVLGGIGAGSNTDDFPKVLTGVLGANIRLVSGYTGTSTIRLAVESKEVDGLCWSYESVASTAKNWLDTNFIRVIVYQSNERAPKVETPFPTAKRAEDLTTDPQSKAVIRASMAPGAISKPFVVPPGVPPERFQALRDAFWATMQDPEFQADSEQARQDLDPSPGDVTERVVNEILGLSPELARRLAEIRK
jgi:tripartite-type tricarboxylate transporter receptor subunit TctC